MCLQSNEQNYQCDMIHPHTLYFILIGICSPSYTYLLNWYEGNAVVQSSKKRIDLRFTMIDIENINGKLN